MGSYFDEQTIKPKNPDDLEELKNVFQEIVEQCLYDYGHAGYTGTFAEKDPDDLLVVEELDGVTKTVWSLDEARKHAMDCNDKWGPTFAYRLNDGSWYIAGWCSN